MAKAILNGHLYLYVPQSTPERPVYAFSETDIECESFITIKPWVIETDVPADFDPVPAQLSMLDKLEQEARKKLAEQLMHIEDRRAKLLSIGFDAPATVPIFEEDEADFPF